MNLSISSSIQPTLTVAPPKSISGSQPKSSGVSVSSKVGASSSSTATDANGPKQTATKGNNVNINT